MSAESIAIIGGGHAGDETAGQLRELGFAGKIVVFEESADSPYERPDLTKGALSGTDLPKSLWRRHEGFFEEQGIDYRPSVEVSALLPGESAVQVETSLGVTESFSSVVLATGMAPRLLNVPGLPGEAIHYVQNLSDLIRLRDVLEAAESVAIVGGGFIGAEAAASLRSRNLDVTLIQNAPRLMPRAVGEKVSDYFEARHVSEGVSVRLNSGVLAGHPRQNGVTGLELTSGEHISADVVVGAIGVTPRTGLAIRAGIQTERDFIVVNQYGQSSHPRIFSVGDIALGPHPLGGPGSVPIPSLDNASWTALTTARFLVAGEKPGRRPAPTFWTEQFGMRLQIAGLLGEATSSVHRPGAGKDSFSVMHYAGEKLIAVEALSKPKDYLAVKRALSFGLNIPADVAAWPDLDLSEFVRSVMGQSANRA